MADPIPETEVRRIARLARLALDDDEVRRMAAQLGDILAYFGQLSSVKTDGVEPMAHPLPLRNIIREDVPADSLSAEQALANAPQRIGDHFRTPTVVDHGGA